MPAPDRPLPGPPLPIDEVLGALRETLSRGHAVLSAPPGSGKTTRVPLAMLDEPWLGDDGILMLEPRRPAARMAAARMAHVLGEAVGERIGYQVRFERKVGPQTRLQVLTEGILTRRIQGDPELHGIGLLIFDEFHERSLQADLGLALALDAASALRPDLRILIMSATLDTRAASRLLGGVPVIEGRGRSHPVDLIYADRTPGRNPVDSVVAGVERGLAEQEGDLLAFLPGGAEIRRARERLAARIGDRVLLLPLHGALPLREQELALQPNPGPRRRVVLSTDIAETSLTIEGVTTVIDSGLSRKPRFHPGSGLTRLVTEAVSLASADQRAGRAGRLGPGTCYRLWTRDQETGRPAHRPAEILQADLAPLVLELALWGVRRHDALAWLDPPPAPAWAQAVALLRELGALDDAGAVTPLGRRMAEFAVHPRLARMLAGASDGQSRRLAADLAALLSERDPWPASPGVPRPADLDLRLRALRRFRTGGRTGGVDRTRLAAADRLSRKLARGGVTADQGPPAEPGALLAVAYPDRVAQRRPGGDGRYRLASGTGGVLPADDALSTRDLLVIADMESGDREGRIRLALPINEPTLRAVLADRIETTDEMEWDRARHAVSARREERLGALVLSSRPRPLGAGAQASRLLAVQVAKDLDRSLAWTPEARQLQARVALLRRVEPEVGWPDLSDPWLAESAAEWLPPWLAGKSSLAEVRALDVRAVLSSRLDWERRRRLDEQAPSELTTPAGNRRGLDYTGGESPVLAVPLQEMFGAARTPAVCGGRVPVTLHLLSPARRPVQVTSDLAGFWSRGYAEVRKELRGRYPKHHWPEDPISAHAIPGGVRRKRPT